jgi:acetoin utilization protein AcuB
MHVKDVMSSNPVTILPTDTLQTALTRMGKNFRRLPVVDEQSRLVGIITDRDLRLAMNSPYVLRERWQDDFLLNEFLVENCMTAQPAYTHPDVELTTAIDLILKGRFSGLPVVDAEQKVVGVLTVTDLLRALQNRLSATNT